MDTPYKKPVHRDLLDWEKDYNTSVNKTRWVIEQVIANFKTCELCTPTIADRWQPSPRRSQRWSPYTSTCSRE
jgi:hypothetical protein